MLLLLLLVPYSVIGLHRTINFSFLGISAWGIDLDYCDVEWFALEMNQDHSAISETAFKYCILKSFVDYKGCCISSKEFLSTVIDIMVI